ncbi:protein phosphatase 2C, putative [Eimeria mitis]|uniref:Protein phosphatase 2C, putative n=1 Tax=Eimeria mitis TaxID=44415 RepID=U6KG73_9EIME|nr:protein phosphatase 2C, putative [Eimeria mitis]CDJ35786.1 protein phosphatase 2C, putative [Eimeria mitis]
MGTYLSSPLSGKEVASGACESMGLRWGVCSMQGWRVSMEDAHLVLYAKRVGNASTANASGAPSYSSPREGGPPSDAAVVQQQHRQQKDDLSPHGPRLSAVGMHQQLLSQLLLGSGSGLGPQRGTDGCYVFLPAEVEMQKDDVVAAAAPAAGGAAEDGGDGADMEAAEPAEGDAAATPSSKKTNRVGRAVRRQFTLRRRGTSTASETDAAETAGAAAAAGIAGAAAAAPTAAAAAGFSPASQVRGAPSGTEAPGGPFAAGPVASSGQTVQHADLCIFAVFDGHGGAHVSRFAAAHMRPLLESLSSFHRGDLSTALRSAYLRIDDLLREESSQDDLMYLTSHSPLQLLQHKQQLQQEQLQQQQQHEHNGNVANATAAPTQHKGLRSTLSNLGQHFGVKSQQQQQQQQQAAAGQGNRAGMSSSSVGETPSRQHTGAFASRGSEEEMQRRQLRSQAEDSLDTFNIRATAAATAAAANAAATERSTERSGAAAILAAYAANSPNASPTHHSSLSFSRDLDSRAAAAAGPAAAAAVAASDPPAPASDEEVAAASATAATTAAAAAAVVGQPEETVATKKGRKLSFSGLVDVVTRSVGLGRFFGRNNGSSSTSRSLASTAGSTALTVCVTPTRLIVANVGDSRCVLCRGREIVELSQDHKPQLAEERIRIYAAGGFLEMGRVNGNLNLSRALGDLVYKADDTLPPEKQILSGCPDIVTVNRDPEKDEFLVIGCDGIWELLSSAEVVEFVRRRIEHTPDLCQILKELFDSLISPNPALFEYGCDNMTAFIVDLKAEKRRQSAAAAAASAAASDTGLHPSQEQQDARHFSKTSSTESLSGSVYGDGDLKQTNHSRFAQGAHQQQQQQQQEGHQDEERNQRQ